MKRSCKNINICDANTILPFVRDCILRHWKRHDFRDMLRRYGMSRGLYYAARAANDKSALEPYIARIAQDAADRIRRRELGVGRVVIREQRDKTTGKLRQIGRETPMQQVFDHIAVGASADIWRRRIVPQQASSIEGRGQVYGMRMIRGWIRADNRCIRWARKHGVRYSSRCRYFVKLDIRKCYPSARAEVFLRLFARDCGNADLIWLWRALLMSHRVDGYEGMMIGALPSEWACQYMIAYLYREAMGAHKMRRGRRVRLVTHALIYLDDILLIGASRQGLQEAVGIVTRYACERLGLTIKPTWSVYRLGEQAIDMMGYVVHRSGRVSIRGRDFVRMRRMILRGQRRGAYSARQAMRTCAYGGYIKHTDSRRFRRATKCDAQFRLAAKTISATRRKERTA